VGVKGAAPSPNARRTYSAPWTPKGRRKDDTLAAAADFSTESGGKSAEVEHLRLARKKACAFASLRR
jgi:hypothetical protein